jgi:hypothetical protein
MDAVAMNLILSGIFGTGMCLILAGGCFGIGSLGLIIATML